MSLAVRILAVILLLGLALAIRLGVDGGTAWRAPEHARATRDLEQRSSRLLDAAAALAVERGLTAGFPQLAVRVVSQSAGELHLAFAFASEAERRQTEQALRHLTGGAAMAA